MFLVTLLVMPTAKTCLQFDRKILLQTFNTKMKEIRGPFSIVYYYDLYCYSPNFDNWPFKLISLNILVREYLRVTEFTI